MAMSNSGVPDLHTCAWKGCAATGLTRDAMLSHAESTHNGTMRLRCPYSGCRKILKYFDGWDWHITDACQFSPERAQGGWMNVSEPEGERWWANETAKEVVDPALRDAVVVRQAHEESPDEIRKRRLEKNKEAAKKYRQNKKKKKREAAVVETEGELELEPQKGVTDGMVVDPTLEETPVDPALAKAADAPEADTNEALGEGDDEAGNEGETSTKKRGRKEKTKEAKNAEEKDISEESVGPRKTRSGRRSARRKPY